MDKIILSHAITSKDFKNLSLLYRAKITEDVFTSDGKYLYFFKQIVYEKDERDELIEEGCYFKELRRGYWIFYYLNGQKEAEGHYVEDFQDGFWISYHSNGMKSEEHSFIRGVRYGHYISYHDNGQIAYRDGWEEGTFTSYDEERWSEI